jgi:hypothetical protein
MTEAEAPESLEFLGEHALQLLGKKEKDTSAARS